MQQSPGKNHDYGHTRALGIAKKGEKLSCLVWCIVGAMGVSMGFFFFGSFSNIHHRS